MNQSKPITATARTMEEIKEALTIMVGRNAVFQSWDMVERKGKVCGYRFTNAVDGIPSTMTPLPTYNKHPNDIDIVANALVHRLAEIQPDIDINAGWDHYQKAWILTLFMHPSRSGIFMVTSHGTWIPPEGNKLS